MTSKNIYCKYTCIKTNKNSTRLGKTLQESRFHIVSDILYISAFQNLFGSSYSCVDVSAGLTVNEHSITINSRSGSVKSVNV